MTNRLSSYRQSLLEDLTDPIEASAYLNAAIELSPESFLKALRNVAQARQMTKIAKSAGLQRESLYRSLSDQGNPTFGTLSSVLEALGLRMSFTAEGVSRASMAPHLPVEISHPPVAASRSETEGSAIEGERRAFSFLNNVGQDKNSFDVAMSGLSMPMIVEANRAAKGHLCG